MVELSIVVTSFNHQRFVRKAVESLLAENLTNAEIIVVDDASTDGSVKILEGLPIRLLRHDSNRGQAAAQNTGLKAAQGEYVAFFDSDDILIPGGMAERLEWLQQTHEPVAAGLPGDVIDAEGKRLGSYGDIFFGGKEIHATLISSESLASGEQFPSPIWLLMFRRDLLRQLGSFDEGLKISHDNDYWHRLVQRVDVPCLPIPVADYRLHGDNLCGKMVDGRFRYSSRTRAENLFVKLKHELHFS